MEQKYIDNFLTTLTSKQKKYLLEKLKVAVFGNISQTVKLCPCCNFSNFIKHGNYKGVQKYKCKNTSKIFSYKSKTVISGISKPDKLLGLLEMMVNKKLPTITEIQEKILISRQTAFSWRTKIITSLYEEIELDNQIIEFDETNFRLSRKGRKRMLYSRERGGKLAGDNPFNVKVFMSYSRATKKLELYTSHIGRSTHRDIENYLGSKREVVIYSDKHQAYKKYCDDKDVIQHVFKAKDHVSKVDKSVHNQTLNYYCGSLQKFLDEDLRGVSTKYIQGYLNWFMFIENCVKKEKDVTVNDVVMENKLALDIYKQKEKEFQYFLKINGRSNYGTCRDRYYGEEKRNVA